LYENLGEPKPYEKEDAKTKEKADQSKQKITEYTGAPTYKIDFDQLYINVKVPGYFLL